MARSSGAVRRLAALGLGALVVGAVLLGTGVAVAAQGNSPSQQAQPLKKGTTTTAPTTTTTTSTTIPGTTTTTVPCSTPASATGLNSTTGTTATLTMTPGYCLVSGQVVALSGTGFQQSIGAALECNSDAGQPTVMVQGNATPVSCTNPLATNGPGIISVPAGGVFGPVNFTIQEGNLGPPCGPSACTKGNKADKDSSGGSPFTDAGNYPCPPTTAQIAAGDTCGIIFGTLAGDGVTLPINFNVEVPPPAGSLTTPTAPPTAAAGSSGKAAASAKAGASTKAGSSSLAFTGTGPGLWWLALVGMVLMALGVFVLALVDQPRRLLRLATSPDARWRKRSP